MIAGIRFVVTGRVQGVGFRAYVLDWAERLDIGGEVWNRRDGAVEGFAFGDRLPEFQAKLHSGPGHVEGVNCQPASLMVQPEQFSISRTV